MIRGRVALAQVQPVEGDAVRRYRETGEVPARLRVRVVVYDEAGDRVEPLGLTSQALSQVADGFAGLPVLDQRHAIEAEPGRRIGKVIESRRVGGRIEQVQEWFGPHAHDAIQDALEGVRQGFSISWDPTSRNRAVRTPSGRTLHTDVIPLEVTRTFAPVVQGTGLVAILRRTAAMGQNLGEIVTAALAALAGDGGDVEAAAAQVAESSGLAVELVLSIAAGTTNPSPDDLAALAAALGVEVEALADALAADEAAETEDGDEHAEHEDPPAMSEASQAAAAQAMRQALRSVREERDRAEGERVKLARRVQALEREADQERRRVALRDWRRTGHLSGSMTQLEQELADVPVEHIRAVLRHVQPAEPRLPGEVLTDGSDAPDQPEAQRIATAEDIDRVALRLAVKNGSSYDEERRRIVNSLVSPSARPRGNA
jgi:transcriptional regulator with XRE-family HTH domain